MLNENKIASLNRYQKGILIAMTVMILIFTFVYPKVILRVGYLYNDTILTRTQENGDTVFSGKVQGEKARFIILDENTVSFDYGEKSYGSYVLNEDAAAIPRNKEFADQMSGIEVRNNDRILFRGGVLDVGDSYRLYNEDGTFDNFGFSIVTGNGIAVDEMGNVIDSMEPSASVIYELLHDPELTHKGNAMGWVTAVFVCILNAVSILFADELFRWNLSFRIRSTENAEPSDWEIAGRYISWTVMIIMALVIFIMGLQ